MTDESVLANLRPFEWDSNESVSYEVAIEAISLANAAITPLLETAEQQGDNAAIAELVNLRKQCIAARDDLRPTDHQAVATVTRYHRDLAEQLHRRAA